jgi:hypothetical protein
MYIYPNDSLWSWRFEEHKNKKLTVTFCINFFSILENSSAIIETLLYFAYPA